MKMKKVLSMALALCMVFGSAAALPEGTFTQSTSITATAESVEQTEGDFTYQLSSDGTFALVTGFSKPSVTTCTIPETLGGVPVEVIVQEAFKDKTNLQSVTFPSKLRNIAVSAFEGCTKLERVTIPNSVTTIGEKAFDKACTIRCKSGTPAQSYAVLNGNPIEYISGDFVFKQLENNKVEIVEYSGEDTNLTIPSEWSNNTVTSIAAGVFKDCTSLKRVTIPKTVEDIGNNAFDKSCTIIGYASSEAIYYAKVHGNNIEYISGNFVYKELSDNTVQITEYHGEDAALTIPAAWGEYPVSTIGMRVFENNATLTSVTISDSVTTIKDNAFVGCANLVSATVPKTVTKLGVRALGYIYGDDNMPKVDPNFTLKCYKGSAAEKYAADNKLKYELLDVEHVAAKAATCTVDGNIEYWKYNGKYYSDSKATTEITQAQTVVKASHSYPTAWTSVKKPTIVSQGKETRKCTVCGNTESRSYGTALTTDRAFGADRFATSLEIASKLANENEGKPFDNIIIASGANYADALSATYLAKVKNAPILITAGDAASVINPVYNYIYKNTAAKGNIYIVGGTGVVPESVVTTLKAKGYNVKRLAGKDRFITNIEVLKEAGVKNEELLVASGNNYADALSASAVGKPILLVPEKVSSMTAEQKAYLKTISSTKAYIIGGIGAVTQGIENELKTFVSTERVSGQNRYETSVSVANKFFKNPKAVAITYGLNYPDGLCGGPLAISYGCPLLLTTNNEYAYAAAYSKSAGVKSAITFGGTTLVSDATVNKILGK